MTKENPLIEAHHTMTDLSVGSLQSHEWNEAQPVTIDRYWSGDPAPASRHCEARVLWSSKALHVRFVCHQEEKLIVSAAPQIDRKSVV